MLKVGEDWLLAHPSHEETAKQRLDRNFAELLQELRVAQTGVQILLGFLLTMVFAPRFTTVSDGTLWLYVGAVCLTTLSMGCLVAPVAAHRVLFRRGMKPHLVHLTHVLASAGLLTLLLAVGASVTLALVAAVGFTPGALVGVTMSMVLLLLWYVLPLLVRRLHRPDDVDQDQAEDPMT